MFLQEHDLPSILVTEVYVHGMVDDLAVRETEPVQVVQEVAHAPAEGFAVLVALAVVDHLLEHQLAALPLRLGHDRVQDHVVLLLVHGVVDGVAGTLRELALLVQQVVGLVLDLVEVAELEPAHELVFHVLLDGVDLADLQHGDVRGVDAVPDPSQPGFGFGALQHVAHLLHDVVQQRLKFRELGLLLLRVIQPLPFLPHVLDVTADCEAQCDDGQHAFGPVCFLLVRYVHTYDHVGVTLRCPDEFVDINELGFVLMVLKPK